MFTGARNSQITYNDGSSKSENKRSIQQPSFIATTNKHNRKMMMRNQVSIDSLVLISGSAHKDLANKISDIVKVPIADVTVGRYADGEVQIILNTLVRGKHVFIIQPCAKPGKAVCKVLIDAKYISYSLLFSSFLTILM